MLNNTSFVPVFQVMYHSIELENNIISSRFTPSITSLLDVCLPSIQGLCLSLASAFCGWRRSEDRSEVSAASETVQSIHHMLITQWYIPTYVAGYGSKLISDSVRILTRHTALPCRSSLTGMISAAGRSLRRRTGIHSMRNSMSSIFAHGKPRI